MSSDTNDGGIVTHMVMLKVKEDATTIQKDEMIAQILNLKHTVPGVLDVKAGLFTPFISYNIHTYQLC